MRIGISGPSGSGKTTIARALAQLLARKGLAVQILHQDDFYLQEADIPLIDTGEHARVVNWDCPEALDMVAFKRALSSFDAQSGFHEAVQKDLRARAKEDQNDAAATDVSFQAMQEADKLQVSRKEKLLIVDGFMLYQDDEVLAQLDLAILLRGSHDMLKARREARSGYVTLEGFWQDPPGYFDDVVWAEFVRTHKHLFVDGNVEGQLLDERLKTPESLDTDVDASFRFVVNQVASLL